MTDAIDYGQIFARSPNPYMVVDRELRFVAANEAYLRVTASRLDELLGRPLFERFPNDPNDPNNLPARMVRASLERVLATGAPDVLALVPYRVARRPGEVGPEAERLWSATHTPIFDDRGEVAFILQHTVDVTELEQLRREGASETSGPTALAGVRAGVLSRAGAVQEANRRLDAERRELLSLFDQAPGFVCFLRGRDHVFELANAAYYRVVGHRDLIGRSLGEAMPEVVEQGFVALLDKVFTSGEPYQGAAVRVLLQRAPGEPMEEAFVDFVYQPVRSAEGAVVGIFVQGSDVTARVAASRVAEAFSAELLQQSEAVRGALEAATRRIRDLEAELARGR